MQIEQGRKEGWKEGSSEGKEWGLLIVLFALSSPLVSFDKALSTSLFSLLFLSSTLLFLSSLPHPTFFRCIHQHHTSVTDMEINPAITFQHDRKVMHAKRPKVLIVGAGLGGLTLGAILEKSGIPYEIFERAPLVKPLGNSCPLCFNLFHPEIIHFLLSTATYLYFFFCLDRLLCLAQCYRRSIDETTGDV